MGRLYLKLFRKNMDYSQFASSESIEKTGVALKNNGIKAVVVENATAAKNKVLELLPKGAEVMVMSSETLRETGITELDSVRTKFDSVDEKTRRQLGAAPDWAVGSVHAVTEDGKLLIASNTGSQLGAYVYGAAHVIFVVGTQKIVKNLDEAVKRIYEYVLPLESERANKAYNITTGSFVSKLLIINRELQPDRVTVVLVKEKLGF